MKKYLFIALGALLCFAVGCAGPGPLVPASEPTPESAPEPTPESTPEPTPETQEDVPPPDIITGSIVMEDGGVITFELYPDIAPQSVRNFVYLARQGFYDGLTFHRIMTGFMIQGGRSRDGEGGGPGYSIFGEFADNGFENNLGHTRGVMSMARLGHDFNSASSQFFICHADRGGDLDGKYAAFGMVTSGMDVVDRIAETPVIDDNGTVLPEDMPVISTITIDGDFELPEPDKLPR